MTRKHYPAWLRRRRHGSADLDTIESLAGALCARDEDAIRVLLHPEVTVVIDSGGHVHTAPMPVTGSEAAAAELRALMTPGTFVATASINGVPGLTLVREGRVVAALTAAMRSRVLSNFWIVCNPDKLRHWNR
ncbi:MULTISPECIES: hypothetical protein [unclassified Microbacterium]|uniref:hypothetical protein n=1 Tax=unclassified Microbacterium TaxID=2609290 RepID=UPI00109C4C4C|nr:MULTISPECIES: hypothetical protein [unclassified Microbacterium]